MPERKNVKSYIKFIDLYNGPNYFSERDAQDLLKRPKYFSERDAQDLLKNCISMVMAIVVKEVSYNVRVRQKQENFIQTSVYRKLPLGFTRLGLFVNAGISVYKDGRWWRRLTEEKKFLNSPSDYIIFDKSAYSHKIHSGTPVIIAIKNGYFDILMDLIEFGAEKKHIYDEFVEEITEDFNIQNSEMFKFCARCTCRSYPVLNEMSPMEKCLYLSIVISLNEFMTHIINSCFVSDISNNCWRIIFSDMIVQDNINLLIDFIRTNFDLKLFGDRILYDMAESSVLSRDYYHIFEDHSHPRCVTRESEREFIHNTFYRKIMNNFDKILELIFYCGYEKSTYEEVFQLSDNTYGDGLKELASTPMSLKNICRKSVRRCMITHGHNVQNAINSLSVIRGLKAKRERRNYGPIPARIKTFLNMLDFIWIEN